jgi:hypothetical protein
MKKMKKLGYNGTEVRFLHVILYMAERAWSHSMEKRQLPDGPNAHSLSHRGILCSSM